MKLNLRQILTRWSPVIFIFVTIFVLVYFWYTLFPPTAWEDTPNYLQMYIDFIITRPTDAFLIVSTGPGEIISWVFLPVYSLIIIHAILYLVGKQRKHQFTMVNKYYIIYLAALGLFVISFQNASQYYGWYWNPELNAPGFVDTWTHITSPWLLGALFVPLSLERFFGWDRKYRWFFIFAVLAIIALGWEISETLDVYYRRPPDPTYFNYPMDSLKDIILGVGIGTILSCWIYERLVVDVSEKSFNE